MPVRVHDEGSVIVWPVVRTQTGTAVVTASVFYRCSVKPVDGFSIWRRKSQMETWAWRSVICRLEFDSQFVTATGRTIADRLVGFSPPQILPDANVSKWRKHRIVECG